MSFLILLMTAAAEAPLEGEARTAVPDRLSVEVALARTGLAADEASWLGGETWWRTDEDGQLHQRHRLGWTLLSGREVLSTEAFDEQGCAVLEGRDPVPGNRQVHLYDATVSDPDPVMNAGIGARPGICLLYTSPSPRDRYGSRMPSSA